MANTICRLFLDMPAAMPTIPLSEYQYDLPDDRIAKYPLADRALSKLLVWKAGKVQHSYFKQLSDYLTINSTLFFNNTKVIPARILFEKETGATIEVFLLSPANHDTLLADALQETGSSMWRCAIGNAKRWPESIVLNKALGSIGLSAAWRDREKGLVQFTWTPAETPFARIIESAGAVPLPPYLHREAEAIDRERYQTVYSRLEGAVAAPTAGLHFTPAIMDELTAKGIQTDFLTLHVSAGTFLPIKTQNAAEHRMHEEEVVIHKQNIINLLQGDRQVIAVGTTAMRTLESLYWFGALLSANPEAPFMIDQELPYRTDLDQPTSRQALELVLKRMDELDVDELAGHTSIYIIPGYRFRITQGLVTNFHQPGSTLLVLISAFAGPGWRALYDEAMNNGYRFLSYGDSSLLLPVNY